MPRNEGFLYPEYDHYGPSWKADLTRRLQGDGRWEEASAARKKYAKDNGVDPETAWRWLCDAYPPVGAPESVVEEVATTEPREEMPSNNRGVEAYQKQMRLIPVEELKRMGWQERDLYVNWAITNAHIKGVRQEDAPHPYAWSLLVHQKRELAEKGKRGGYRGFSNILEYTKKMKRDTDVKSEWLKDDQRLQQVMERSIENARAASAAAMGSLQTSSS